MDAVITAAPVFPHPERFEAAGRATYGDTGVRFAQSTLTAIMGRMAIDCKREVTWDEIIKPA